jgi:hypothetical protein
MDLDAAQDAFERARDDAVLEEDVVFVPFTSQPRTTPAAAFHPPGEGNAVAVLIFGHRLSPCCSLTTMLDNRSFAETTPAADRPASPAAR